jgi:hypothetical protein
MECAMPTGWDPEEIESEQHAETRTTDELTGEELDRVVGGGDVLAMPQPPTISNQIVATGKEPRLVPRENDYQAGLKR